MKRGFGIELDERMGYQKYVDGPVGHWQEKLSETSR